MPEHGARAPSLNWPYDLYNSSPVCEVDWSGVYHKIETFGRVGKVKRTDLHRVNNVHGNTEANPDQKGDMSTAHVTRLLRWEHHASSCSPIANF